MAEYLVELGIDSISLNPDTVIATTRQVLEVEARLGRGPRARRPAHDPPSPRRAVAPHRAVRAGRSPRSPSIQTHKAAPMPVILVGEACLKRLADVDFLVECGSIDADVRECSGVRKLPRKCGMAFTPGMSFTVARNLATTTKAWDT